MSLKTLTHLRLQWKFGNAASKASSPALFCKPIFLFPSLFFAFITLSKWSYLKGSRKIQHPMPFDVIMRLLFISTFMSPFLLFFHKRGLHRVNILYLFLCALYLPSYMDGSERRGGRICLWFKKLSLWTWIARHYFDVKLIRTAQLDSKQHFVFGLHPHAIGPYGSVLNINTAANQFDQLFPGIEVRTLAATILFYVPIVRDLWLALGFVDASHISAITVLRRSVPSRTQSFSLDFPSNCLHSGCRLIASFAPRSTESLKPLHKKTISHMDARGAPVDPSSLPALTTFSTASMHISDVGVNLPQLRVSSSSSNTPSPTYHVELGGSNPPSPQHSPQSVSVLRSNTGFHSTNKLYALMGFQSNSLVDSPTNSFQSTSSSSSEQSQSDARHRSQSFACSQSPSVDSLDTSAFRTSFSPRHCSLGQDPRLPLSSNAALSHIHNKFESSPSRRQPVAIYSPGTLTGKQVITTAAADGIRDCNSVGIFIGGKKECLLTSSSSSDIHGSATIYTLYLRKRKGFIRLALETGAHLVPVFTFGDSLAHDQFMYADTSGAKRLKQFSSSATCLSNADANETSDSTSTETKGFRSNMAIKMLRCFNEWWFNVFGVPIPIVRNLVPKRSSIMTIIGRPIPVPFTQYPSESQVNELHMLYINELTKLFYENRDKHECNAVLRII